MTQNLEVPSFNLWSEPWITVERPNATLEKLSLAQTLAEAPHIRALYEPSPLVITGIHRLLLAILQDSLRPQSVNDLKQIWQAGEFSAQALTAFGEKYGHRFDLFSADSPFMQSADLSLHSQKGLNIKPVGTLFHEEPPGSNSYFFNHKLTDAQVYCTSCSVKGLLTIPTHSTSGGRGIRPSINGEPPIYVLPGGPTLFHSLAASLTLPDFEPPEFETEQREWDTPWWRRDTNIVPQYAVVNRVGYLHGLTIPVRRVRFYPVVLSEPCSRCGELSTWGVKEIVCDMGESRPKNAAWWRDPFVAYSKPKSKKDKENPSPLRQISGRAIWREFSVLFLPTKPDQEDLRHFRPTILDQLDYIYEYLPYGESPIPLRVIGLNTKKGQMKIFEWQEGGFAVPPRLLTDLDSAKYIEDGVDFAETCERIIKRTFYDYFGGGGKTRRLKSVADRMSQRYWQILGQEFREYISKYGPQPDETKLFHQWLNQVIRQAMSEFRTAVENIPNEGNMKKPAKVKRYEKIRRQHISRLRLQEEAFYECYGRLSGYRKKHHPQEETA